MRRWQLAWCGTGTAAVCAALAMSLPLSAGAAVTATASFTLAGSYTFTVPAGVGSIAVTAVGAAGGGVTGGNGGQGAALAATVPVTPGEQLVVGVGGVGAGTTGPGAGGTGGLGGGGNGASGASFEGAGGGGASVVGVASSSPGFGLLVVAGGGGGGGAGAAGGNAGSPGAGGGVSGGAGTLTSGGAPGVSTASGFAGSFGLGGQGGTGTAAGGGGGGGYFGGGGGGGGAVGGGGGGGSSFVSSLATNVNGPTPMAQAAAVTLTYAAPVADESTTAVGFSGAQPLGLASTAQALTVTDDGSAPLVVSGVLVGGTNAADFLVTNGCQQQVAAGSSCTILIRFAPQAAGPSAATLTLETNAVVAPPVVALSGTGGAAATQGATGPAGATGPGGAAGAAGKVRLVTCHAVRTTVVRKHHKVHVTKQRCTTKTITGTAKFTTTGASERATLSRAGVVYARGRTRRPGALVLRALRPLTPGRYRLTVRISHGGGPATTHVVPVTVG